MAHRSISQAERDAFDAPLPEVDEPPPPGRAHPSELWAQLGGGMRTGAPPRRSTVVGGALASLLHGSWPGHPDVAILAVGYGELLVPVIADWIKSGYSTIKPPKGGRVTTVGGNTVVYSGSPDEKSLDWLPTPDWKYDCPLSTKRQLAT